jgi:predicted nucleotidyltransferase
MAMTLEKALAVLRAHEKTLRERGVLHAAIFGSVARGDTVHDSDLDILIEIDRTKRIGLFGYAGLCEDIRELFPAAVDVVDANAVKPRFRDSILGEAIYAF